MNLFFPPLYNLPLDQLLKMLDNVIMKRLIHQILDFLYCDKALYTYFAGSLMGILVLSTLQLKEKYYIELPEGVTTEFSPYVRNFLKESKKYDLPKEFEERLTHLTVKYGFPSRLNDDHDFVGWCDLNTTTIIIEKDTWNTYGEGSKQNLIDHELGHCLLERHHRPFLAEGNNPVSIMFPKVMPSDYYTKNKDKLYPELFEAHRVNKIREEMQVFNLTWNVVTQSQFKTPQEFLRFIESEMNKDPYQPWNQKPSPQVVQFDTPLEITAPTPKKARQGK